MNVFITDFGDYAIPKDIAAMLEPRDGRTKKGKKAREFERAICQLDRLLFEHGLSLKDLRFK